VIIPPGHGVDLAARASDFLMLDSFPHTRVKKGKSVELDLRRELSEIHGTSDTLEMVILRGKPLEFAAAVTGLPEASLRSARIQKIAVHFKKS
jgi:hypothetical protein